MWFRVDSGFSFSYLERRLVAAQPCDESFMRPTGVFDASVGFCFSPQIASADISSVLPYGEQVETLPTGDTQPHRRAFSLGQPADSADTD
jgi:hypothetical protein